MPPEITSAEFWQPILPYVVGVIIALCVFVAAILSAAAMWVKAAAKKEDTSAQKEITYLDLVNNLLSEDTKTKAELSTLRSRLDELQTEIIAAKEREIVREKEFAELTLERNLLRQELENIRLELEKMRAEIQRLIDERDALNEKLENERHLRREAEVARIQLEAESETERTRLNSQIEILQGKVAILEQSIDLLKKPTKDELKAVPPEDKPEA